MFFTSSLKGKIIHTLSEKTSLSIGEISEELESNYRSVYKSLRELESNNFIYQKDKKYCLTNALVSSMIKTSNNLLNTYPQEITFQGNLPLTILIQNFDDEVNLTKQYRNILLTNLAPKVQKLYQRFYTREIKELPIIREKIKKIKEKKGRKPIVAEIGYNTGYYKQFIENEIKQYWKIEKNKELNQFLHLDQLSIPYNYFDIIIFSWHGNHYKPNSSLFEYINSYANSYCEIIYLDHDEKTEYLNYLETISSPNREKIKQRRDETHEKIKQQYNNMQTSKIEFNYTFYSLNELIEQFKIQVSLNAKNWTHEDEEKIKQLFFDKEFPLKIEDAYWINSFEYNKH